MTILSVTIDATPDAVWAVLADFGNIADWNPGLRASHLTADQREGVGTSRHCDLLPVGGLDERVSEWVPGERMVIDVVGGATTPIRTARIRFDVAATDAGRRTLVGLDAEYVTRGGALGSTLDALVVRRQLTKGFQGLLAGLKHHVETGETRTPSRKLPIDAVRASAGS